MLYMLPALASTLHIYGIALLVAIFFMRTYHLSKEPTKERLEKAFFWDNWSLVVVIVVMGVGVWRMWLEKGVEYYLNNQMFWWKMGILTVAWLLETPIMIKLIQWRIKIANGEAFDTSSLPFLRKLEIAEGSLMVLVVFCASLMARGYGQTTAIVPEGNLALQQGADIYQEFCQRCHQIDGLGFEGRLAPDFILGSDRLAQSDRVLLKSISEGIPETAMPAWNSVLSVEEQKSVLAWMRFKFGAQK
jgi:putative membrane protein